MALFDSLQRSDQVHLDTEVDTDADFGENRKNKRRHISQRRLFRYFIALVLHNNGTLSRHAKLFEFLGSVTRICVIDRDGILTQGEGALQVRVTPPRSNYEIRNPRNDRDIGG